MRKLMLILLVVFASQNLFSQVYNSIVNYSYNSTPSHGVKIQTNIPFSNGLSMPTIILEGNNYGNNTPIGLSITWYVYNGDFYNPKMSSFGGYTPEVKLAEENGKIIIFINDRGHYDRFTVRAYAKGQGETSAMFEGWTIADAPINSSIIKIVPYENRFAGNIYFPSGVWNNTGNVGIGTTTPEYKLDVLGTIRAGELKVDMQGADFVFEADYPLRPISELEDFVKANKHLPEIAPAKEMQANGVNQSEMNQKLLQKIEELTLYMIEQNKLNQIQTQELKDLREENSELMVMKKEFDRIKDLIEELKILKK